MSSLYKARRCCLAHPPILAFSSISLPIDFHPPQNSRIFSILTQLDNISSPPNQPVPSLRSRHPKDTTKQAEMDSTNDWIAHDTLTASICPTKAVTETVTTETSIGRIILSKYDPSKLQTLYGMMRTTERIHMVDDLRTEVRSRQERAQKWKEVMEIVTMKQRTSEAETADAWRPLDKACKEALENTEELRSRLVWCEQNFEPRKLTPTVVAERRVWDEGAEIKLREGE